MKDRVLIDTSVWIDYLQGTADEELQRLVDSLLDMKEVIVPKIVLAELIQGARSEKDIEVIREFLEAFTVVGEDERTWMVAGKLSYDLKRKGRTINLADCYLAIIARDNGASILSLDKHFKEIQHEAGVKLMSI